MLPEVAPERVELGRMRKSLTKAELASRLGMRPRDLRRILTREATQPDGFAEAVAQALDMPVSFLQQGSFQMPRNVSFRSLASMTKREQEAGEAAGVFAVLISGWLHNNFRGLPTADLPDLAGEDPETAAAACREWMGLDGKAVPHMIGALEHAGVRVYALDEKTMRLNAYAFWQEGSPYVLLNQQKSAEASRFDAAHELGHLVLDREGPSVGKEVEARANAFASAFLMPRSEFIARRPRQISIASLIQAKAHFKVSLAAMIRRCRDTGLIDENRYKWLTIEASRNGFLRSEPRPTTREISVLWPNVRKSMLTRKIDVSSVSHELGLSVSEFCSMTWSPTTIFSEDADMQSDHMESDHVTSLSNSQDGGSNVVYLQARRPRPQ